MINVFIVIKKNIILHFVDIEEIHIQIIHVIFFKDSLFYYSKKISNGEKEFDFIQKQFPKFDFNRFLSLGCSPYIYGGAIRDAIAEKDIHDIDIVCGSKDTAELGDYLLQKDFEKIKEKDSLYEELNNKIFEPHTFKKNNLVIQLIRPSNLFRDLNANSYLINEDQVEKSLWKFISNVDLSCCGVGFNINKGLFEFVDGAYYDALNHQFKLMAASSLYNPVRIPQRVMKLVNRGWTFIEPT